MKMLRMRFQERLANPSAGFGSFLRNMEEILDVACGRQEDYTGKTGPVSQIDAGNGDDSQLVLNSQSACGCLSRI